MFTLGQSHLPTCTSTHIQFANRSHTGTHPSPSIGTKGKYLHRVNPLSGWPVGRTRVCFPLRSKSMGLVRGYLKHRYRHTYRNCFSVKHIIPQLLHSTVPVTRDCDCFFPPLKNYIISQPSPPPFPAPSPLEREALSDFVEMPLLCSYCTKQ